MLLGQVGMIGRVEMIGIWLNGQWVTDWVKKWLLERLSPLKIWNHIVMWPQLTTNILIFSCNTTRIMGLIQKYINPDCNWTPSLGQLHTDNKTQVVTRPYNEVTRLWYGSIKQNYYNFRLQHIPIMGSRPKDRVDPKRFRM